MDQAEVRARRLLGLPPGAGPDDARAAYRRLVKQHHPDLSRAEGAAARTAELTAAYQLLRDLPAEPQDEARGPARQVVAAALVDATTIGIAAPADVTLLLLLDAAHRLGDVAYLDRSAGLVEVVVEFLDHPTSSVVLLVQERGDGVTEIACGVESLSGGSAPPVDAVTRVVFDAMLRDGPAPG